MGDFWDQYGGDLISAGTDIAGSYISGRGQDRAADAYQQGIDVSQAAGEQAIGVQDEVLAGQQQALAPWISAGLQSLDTLRHMASGPVVDEFDVSSSPSYQFRLDEGQKGIENYLASKGLSASGRALKELDRYGQDYASQEWEAEYQRRLGESNTAWDRNRFLASQGYSAVGTDVNALGQYGTNVGNTLLETGKSTVQGLGKIGGARSSKYDSYAQGVNALGDTLIDSWARNRPNPRQAGP